MIDETSATQQQNCIIMEVHHLQGVDKSTDFFPVEHPMEPPDEDRPVKCPMPESSVINVSIHTYTCIYVHCSLVIYLSYHMIV